jgi:FKBP-type peptidyl-prolyl cis-trans isomerase
MRIIGWVVVVSLFGCNGCKEEKHVGEVDYATVQRELIEARKQEHEQEMKRIREFIDENKWPMTETSTGLYYWIYEPGTGRQAQMMSIASLDYKITLLDGTLCYVTDSLEPATVRIGQDNVESGIHEVLTYMHEGDRARVILPSHLAFGFTGDSHRIPQKATIVYDLHLIGIQ